MIKSQINHNREFFLDHQKTKYELWYKWLWSYTLMIKKKQCELDKVSWKTLKKWLDKEVEWSMQRPNYNLMMRKNARAK